MIFYYLFIIIRAVSSIGQCLTNIPASLPNEVIFSEQTNPGQIWTADDQCKMMYGASASFCTVNMFKTIFLNFI